MQNAFDYTIYVHGIFGRNRTVKAKGFKLFESVGERMELKRVLEQAELHLKHKIKPKGQYYIKLVELPTQIKVDDNFVWRTYKPYEAVTLLAEHRSA